MQVWVEPPPLRGDWANLSEQITYRLTSGDAKML